MSRKAREGDWPGLPAIGRCFLDGAIYALGCLIVAKLIGLLVGA